MLYTHFRKKQKKLFNVIYNAYFWADKMPGHLYHLKYFLVFFDDAS